MSQERRTAADRATGDRRSTETDARIVVALLVATTTLCIFDAYQLLILMGG